MKKFASAFAIFGLVIFAVSCNAESKVANKKSLDNFDEQLSYAVGMDMGRSLKGIQHPLNMAIVYQAIETAMSGDTTNLLLNDSALRAIKQEFSKVMMAKQDSIRKADSAKNKAEGEKFLAENKSKAGVTTTESGLQYKVITEGQGEKPTAASKVKVHYTGKLLNGEVFDSSVERKRPLDIQLTSVVKGWQEALKLMPVGSKWEIWIPSELGYGERGGGRKIGPNAALYFEIELLEILKEEPKK